MKKIVLILGLTASLLSACNSEEHGNPPAGDLPPNSAPKDFDTSATKDTVLLPH